ncbi:MAG TPA: WD40 repeat domain-containing protein [Roseimicrobium sp.]|nr:WD40 repeat domain-containing protein [Roseimicrobium sp.]
MIQSFAGLLSSSTVAPVANGSAFYYSSSGSLYRWTVATRTSEKVYTENSANFSSPDKLELSVDNSKLAYLSTRASDGRTTIGIVDVAAQTLAKRIVLPAGFSPSRISFVNADARILAGGLRLYNIADGALIGSTATSFDSYCVNPLRTRAFAIDNANTQTICLDLTAAASMPTVWSQGVLGLNATLACSADGKALASRYFNSQGFAGVRFWKTSNGNAITGNINLDSTSEILALAPDKNELIAGTYNDLQRLQRWSFNSTSGASTHLPDLQEGFGAPETNAPVAVFGPAENPKFLVAIGLGFWDLRNVSDGNYANLHLGGSPGLPGIPTAFSPNGQYYIRIGFQTGTSGYGVHIHRVSDQVRVASNIYPDAYDGPDYYGWANDSSLYAAGNPASQSLRLYSFNGSTLTKTRELTSFVAAKVAVTPDASKVVAWNFDGTSSKVYNASNGNTIGTFPMQIPSSLHLVEWELVGNLVAIHEWVGPVDGGYRNQVRFVDLAQATLPVVKTVSYIDPETPFDLGSARVTPDASLVTFSNVSQILTPQFVSRTNLRMIRVSDNAEVRNFTNLSTSSAGRFLGSAISKDGRSLIMTNTAGAIFSIAIPPTIVSLNLNPSSVFGGATSTGTVTLSLPAPTGGTTVNLSADTGLGVPATLVVPEGQQSGDFTITTPGVDSDTALAVNATLDGITQSASLTVKAATTLTLTMSPPSVDGGNSSTGTASLNAKAGPSGKLIGLSSDKGYVTVPAGVSIAASQSSNTFTATTTDPGFTSTATITGTMGAVTATTTLQVRSTYTVTAVLQPAAQQGLNAFELVVTISPAPTTDKTFNLTGDAVLTPPATITVATGKTTASIGIPSKATSVDTLASVTLTTPQGFSQSATATVLAPTLANLFPTVNSVTGATTVNVLVALNGAAPAGFSLAASSSLTSVATIPATVSIPENTNFAVVPVTVKKVTVKKQVVITIGNQTFTITALPAP